MGFSIIITIIIIVCWDISFSVKNRNGNPVDQFIIVNRKIFKWTKKKKGQNISSVDKGRMKGERKRVNKWAKELLKTWVVYGTTKKVTRPSTLVINQLISRLIIIIITIYITNKKKI